MRGELPEGTGEPAWQTWPDRNQFSKRRRPQPSLQGLECWLSPLGTQPSQRPDCIAGRTIGEQKLPCGCMLELDDLTADAEFPARPVGQIDCADRHLGRQAQGVRRRRAIGGDDLSSLLANGARDLLD